VSADFEGEGEAARWFSFLISLNNNKKKKEAKPVLPPRAPTLPCTAPSSYKKKKKPLKQPAEPSTSYSPTIQKREKSKKGERVVYPLPIRQPAASWKKKKRPPTVPAPTSLPGLRKKGEGGAASASSTMSEGRQVAPDIESSGERGELAYLATGPGGKRGVSVPNVLEGKKKKRGRRGRRASHD